MPFFISILKNVGILTTVWHKILMGENFDKWASGKFLQMGIWKILTKKI